MAKVRSDSGRSSTAEAIFNLIDSLPESERCRLFSLLAYRRYPENEYVNDLERLLTASTKLVTLNKRIAGLGALLNEISVLEFKERVGRARLSEVRVQMDLLALEANSVPKRQMSKVRIDTAQLYLRLLGQFPKQLTALHKLVNSPGEIDKGYARRYQHNKDEEALRGYIKSLMATYHKHQAKLTVVSDCQVASDIAIPKASHRRKRK